MDHVEDAFKVIIVGGGPTGLAAAHALHLAKIDFVVLESKPDLSQDTGASLVLAPHSLRIMHQFGILDHLMQIGAPLKEVKSFTKDGRQFNDAKPFGATKKRFGAVPTAFHRHELIQAMYVGLPEQGKQRCFMNKKVIDIDNVLDGVVVYCEDGSNYKGTIVLGADGVYSRTRRLMRSLATKNDAGLPWDDGLPFFSAYRCLWCSFPRPSEPGESSDTQHKDRSIMYISGVERGWIFLYEKLPVKTLHAQRYSEQDIEDFAAMFADWPITNSLRVKDVFAKRLTAGMSELHEGILTHWSWKRIVLAGDVCHRFTPNAGQGFNTALQDVALLCNLLHSALSAEEKRTLSSSTLETVFDCYQTERLDRIGTEYKLSHSLTRIHAWSNPSYRFFGRYIMPLKMFQELFGFLMPCQLQGAYVLDCVHCKEPFVGSLDWTCKMYEE